MGGKNSQSTQQVTIPPEVLARYNSVNAQAQQAAAAPFQTYGGEFVAPVNAQQTAGINTTNQAANSYQPYYTAANTAANTAYNAAQPYNAQATNTANAAYNAAQPYLTAATNTTQGGLAAGNANLGAATNVANASYAGAQPYLAGATAYGLAGGNAVNPTDLNADAINKYMNPYLSTVLGSTAGLLNQNNQQAMSGALGNTMSSGAFGGDRAGIAAANLNQQQMLANANIYSGIASNAYDQALQTAQGQQGLNLSAEQANRAALQQTGQTLSGLGQLGYSMGQGQAQTLAGLGGQGFQQAMTGAQQLAALGQQGFTQGQQQAQTLAGLGQQQFGQGTALSQLLAQLGTGAQTAGLAGGQAQLGAGQVQQQTQQALDTAKYNQFLQQQSYPFQVAQFLANIAEGTGALSGQTTTTTQPLFSDERLKEGVEPVGKLFDGTNVIRYNFRGDPTKRIGLSAQEVEQRHPEAVGLAGGYKTVEHGAATEDAAQRGHFALGGLPISDKPIFLARGGLAPANDDHVPRKAYAAGGLGGGYVPGEDMAAMLAAQAQMFGPYGGGLYGGQGGAEGGPYAGHGYVPTGGGGTHTPLTPGTLPPRASAAEQLKALDTSASDIAKTAQWINTHAPSWSQHVVPTTQQSDAAPTAPTPAPTAQNLPITDQSAVTPLDFVPAAARGGRMGYDDGGSLPYSQQTGLDIPTDKPDIKPLSPGGGGGGGSGMLGQMGSMASGLGSLASGAAALLPLMGLAGGGRVGYADGGMPGLDIPNDAPGVTPLSPGGGGGGSGGGMIGQMGQMASGLGSLASGAAKFLPLVGLAAGGRIGRDAGGRAGFQDGGDPGDILGRLSDPSGQDNPIWSTIGDVIGTGAKGLAQAGSSIAGGAGRAFRGADQAMFGPGSPLAEAIAANTPNTPASAPTGSAAAAPAPPAHGSVPGHRPPGGPTSAKAAQDAGLAAQRLQAIGPTGDLDAAANAMGSQLGATNAAVPAGLAGQTANVAPPISPAIAPRPVGPVATPGGLAGPADLQRPTAADLAAATGTPQTAGGPGGLSPTGQPAGGAPGGPGGPGGGFHFFGGLGGGLDSAIGGAGHFLGEAMRGNPNFLIPLLKGLSTMATAPTHNLGVALAMGAGSAADAYMPVKQQQAQYAETLAGVHQRMAAMANSIPHPNGTNVRFGQNPTGETWRTADGIPYYFEYPYGALAAPGGGGGAAPAPAAAAVASAAGAPVPAAAPAYKALGQAGQKLFENYGTLKGYDSNPTEQATSGQQLTAMQNAANASEGMKPQLNEYADSLSSFARGHLTPGATTPWAAHTAALWNGLATTLGLPAEWQQDTSGVAASQITTKMQRLLAGQTAQGMDQHSLAAFQSILGATPGNEMTPQAAHKLAAQILMTNQRVIDQGDYVKDLDAENSRRYGAPAGHFLARQAVGAFGEDHNDQMYGREQDALYNLMESGGWDAARRVMQSHDPAKIAALGHRLDAQAGMPISRYLGIQ